MNSNLAVQSTNQINNIIVNVELVSHFVEKALEIISRD